MSDSGKPKLKDGLLVEESTGKSMAVDRVDPKALGAIHVPHIERSRAAGPPPVPPQVRVPKETVELGPTREVGDFRAVGPETLLRLMSQAHVDYFAEDFRLVEGEFVKLRYQLGQWDAPYELHSEAFPLDVDSWSTMRERLSEHIRTSLGDVPLADLGEIPVRMVYFHDASVFVKEDPPEGALCHPLDFGCWLRLNVGEFAEFVIEGRLPEEVRIGLDASYHWLGPDTPQPFHYTKHWRFFAEVLLALSKLLGRPLLKTDPVIAVLLAHTGADLADMVLGLGLQEKRTYETTARVYRPRLEARFRAEKVTVTLEDGQGVMRLYAMDAATGEWKRSITGQQATFERHYAI